jgi:serine/threonine-protein kinase
MQLTFPRTLLRRVRTQDAASEQLLGKYRLVATLGQGGMGTVYLALVRGPGEFRKLLVVKELRRELTEREGFVAMFMEEARLAARLDHPNVVQTLEVGLEAGRHFLAMEYLDGQPLSSLIQRLRTMTGLPLAVHIQILCEVLAGLHYAHELHDYDGRSLHVVHRDISPQNVFVTYHGQVKVVDFGVAKVATAGNLTSPGVFKGKFAYAAPEQTMGQPVDARSDVFAVGVMLWEAIAGRRFAEQIPTVASFKARNQGLEPRIADVSSEVDTLLAEISDKALAVDPARRFESAEAFRQALQKYLELSGERVEGAQIGQIARAAFQEERRAVHAIIERSMEHNGASRSSVAALPFLHKGRANDGPTTVADLSSLVEVSHEADDDKIRAGYADSRVTLPPVRGVPGRRWVIAGVASTIALCGLSVGLMASNPRHPKAPTTTVSALKAQPSAATPDLAGAASARQLAAQIPAEHTSTATGASSIGRRVERAEPPAAASVVPFETALPAKNDLTRGKRSAPPAHARERTHQDGVPAPATTPTSGAHPANPASETSMGSDLRGIRRTRLLPIDVEDPYK